MVGYVIAYKFQLTDPYARGRRRHYALIALAGHDPGRAFKATSIVWETFKRVAGRIIASTERNMQDRKSPTSGPGESRKPTPISSFLTQRTVDPDGFPRQGGTATRPRGLAEMVDNDLFFAEIHRNFVTLLQCLGRQFGGVTVEPTLPDIANDEEHANGNNDAEERSRRDKDRWKESMASTSIAA